MKKSVIKTILLGCFFFTGSFNATGKGQFISSEDNGLKMYHETSIRINDLVHTKLDVRFDYQKRYLYGKEWVTLRPHMYATDSLLLDAKGMEIRNISIVEKGKLTPLKFVYDNRSINIKLDKVYQNTDHYTVYIDYIAKPNELKGVKKNEKGLYFINPDGIEKDKPTQIWTEGEPESSSAWFPTIDKPNQRTTEEISMTVPLKYVTLSNGRLTSQKMNSDGTRTDTWKMELPNSPYLFMMAVGDFKIYKETWRGKEVSYYLEPEYAPYAKDIFGMTPEAIEFFSNALGIDYPWNKYSQIVVRDYVSGAMENTTATMLGEPTQGTKRDLADQYNRTGIEHELFHQWFGDYVTAESWSNLTLNESFGVFGEIIWLEHKFGKDAADELNLHGMQAYLNNPDAKTKDLVRFNYKEKEEVFDGVTYQKGGCILNMLKDYLGDAAFYKGLNIYLKSNAFKSAEAHQLRMALEEASGLDLNWFFNQWYFGAGHPDLNINYQWDNITHTQTVYLNQTQDGEAFIIPLSIDIYIDGKKEKYKSWMREKTDTLNFHLPSKPNLVNVDAHKTLLSKKTDNKTLDEFVFQYFNAPMYLDRYEAIEAVKEKQNEKGGQKILIAALKDKYWGLKIKSINDLDLTNVDIIRAANPILTELAYTDENNLVRASAITALGKLKNPANLNLFKLLLKCESYAIQGAALTAIAAINPEEALDSGKLLENDNKGPLHDAIIYVYTTYGGNDQWPYIYKLYEDLIPPKRFNIIQNFAGLAGRVENHDFASQGISAIKELAVKYKQFGIAPKIIELLNEIKNQRIILGDTVSASAVDVAIDQINETK